MQDYKAKAEKTITAAGDLEAQKALVARVGRRIMKITMDAGEEIASEHVQVIESARDGKTDGDAGEHAAAYLRAARARDPHDPLSLQEATSEGRKVATGVLAALGARSTAPQMHGVFVIKPGKSYAKVAARHLEYAASQAQRVVVRALIAKKETGRPTEDAIQKAMSTIEMLDADGPVAGGAAPGPALAGGPRKGGR